MNHLEILKCDTQFWWVSGEKAFLSDWKIISPFESCVFTGGVFFFRNPLPILYIQTAIARQENYIYNADRTPFLLWIMQYFAGIACKPVIFLGRIFFISSNRIDILNEWMIPKYDDLAYCPVEVAISCWCLC